jgi:hypothetical protein
MYEYGALKPVKVILRLEIRKFSERTMEGMNPTGVQYMYVGKRHNETPYATIIY